MSKKYQDLPLSEMLSVVQEKVLSVETDKILNAENIFTLLYEYSKKDQEHFICTTLDSASKVINTKVLFLGTVNQSIVHPRDIFRMAVADNAAGIIVTHNHPSGTLEPSRSDIQLTNRIKEASKIMGIQLLDHVIISENGYYSFSDEAML